MEFVLIKTNKNTKTVMILNLYGVNLFVVQNT